MAYDLESVAGASTLTWLRFMLAAPAHRQRALLQHYGSPEAALGAPHDELVALIGNAGAQAIANGAEPSDLEAAQRWIERPDCRLVALGDAQYPALWKQLTR